MSFALASTKLFPFINDVAEFNQYDKLNDPKRKILMKVIEGMYPKIFPGGEWHGTFDDLLSETGIDIWEQQGENGWHQDWAEVPLTWNKNPRFTEHGSMPYDGRPGRDKEDFFFRDKVTGGKGASSRSCAKGENSVKIFPHHLRREAEAEVLYTIRTGLVHI